MPTVLLTTIVALLFQGYDAPRSSKSIRWLSDPADAAKTARETQRPILFYVLGRSDDRDRDIERDQKRALADPLVVELASRYVCCKLSRSVNRDVLEHFDLKSDYQMYMVFAGPDGKRIDLLDGLAIAKKETLQQKLALVFRVYRAQLYNSEIKPKLVDVNTPAPDLKAALIKIDEFTILDADADLIALLGREGGHKAIEKGAYELLAKLSTKPAVEFLLTKAAAGDNDAIKALPDCTPGGAEHLIPALDGDDANARLVAYQAATKICKIKNAKPDRFWDGKNEKLKKDELTRVKEQVQKVAERWNKVYAEYR